MAEVKIRLECRNGHSSEMLVGGMTKEEAKDFCGILDGSSPFFVHSPREPENQQTLIGRCVICGAIFDAQVVG